MHNTMITMGKPFQEKNPTLQNLHNVFSNQIDYNTLAKQVLTGVHHHNLNLDLDLERLLLAAIFKNKLDDSNTSPSPSFIVIFQLETICAFTKSLAKTMGKTTMPHVTYL